MIAHQAVVNHARLNASAAARNEYGLGHAKRGFFVFDVANDEQ